MEVTVLNAELNDAMIAEAKQLIGVTLRRTLHNTEATRRGIQAWARMVGDRNPLWLDETHAYQSRFGMVTAHPCWLYSVDNTMVAPKLPGIHALYAGADWEFYREVRLGDSFTVAARLIDVMPKNGKFCGPMVLQVGEVVYFNQRAEKVARVISKTMRTPRDAAVAKGKYAAVVKHRYTREEALAIEDAYDNEVIRGDEPRYWEDVQAGEVLPPIVRALLNSEDMKLFMSRSNPVPAFSRFLEYRTKHPAATFRHPDHGMWDDWTASLLYDKIARLFGFPFAHDTGIQRIAYLGSLVTNWMGDDARLKKLGGELRFPFFFGDSTWCRGKVSKKYVQDGEHLVDLELWAENQDKIQNISHGSATVALPSRSVPG